MRPHPALRALPVVVCVAALLAHAVDYAFLCDDAYISFRYANNLIEGRGLVFNDGERVEGYTNFLWVLMLAALHGLAGVRPEQAAIPLGLGFTVGAATLVARLAARSPVGPGWIAAACASALLASNRSFAVWSTSGLETRAFTFWLLLALWSLHGSQGRPRRLAAGSAALGLAALTRPEALLFGPLAIAWSVTLSTPWDRAAFARRALAAAGPFTAVVAAHTAFRLVYYGAWLPNTFAAKGQIVWWEGGATYLALAVVEYGLPLLLPIAALGAAARARAGDSLHLLSLAWVATHLAFVARVGGDHFEFRMLDVAFPVLHLAVADGVLAVARSAGRAGPGFGAALLGLSLAAQAVIPWTDRQATHHLTERKAGRHHPLRPKHAPWLHAIPGVPPWIATWNDLQAWAAPRLIATRHMEHCNFHRAQRAAYEPYLRARHAIPPGLVIGEGSVGVKPYFLPDVTVVDHFGLTDATIARLPVIPRSDMEKLAHAKRDVSSYLASRVNSQIHAAAVSAADALEHAGSAVELAPGLWMPFDGDPTRFDGRVISRLPGGEGSTALTEDGRSWVVERVVASFERPLEGWSPSGTAFAGNPARGPRPRQKAIFGFLGDGLLNSYHPAQRDAATGALTSAPIALAPGERLGLCIGGGAGPDVGARILGEHGPIATLHGRDEESLRFVIAPDELSGQPITVEVFDDAVGAWGHVLVDQIVVVRAAP